MEIHLIVVEIVFKWWTNQQTNIAIPIATLLAWPKDISFTIILLRKILKSIFNH